MSLLELGSKLGGWVKNNMVGAIQETNRLIEKIRELMPLIEKAEETGDSNRFYTLDVSFIEEIESTKFYKTINRCSGIQNMWEDFKTAIKEYSKEKQDLFDELKKYSILELNKQNFDIDSEIREGFYISIYSKIIIRAKGEISLFDDKIDPVPVILNDGKGNQYNRFQIKYYKKGDAVGSLLNNPYILAETKTQERKDDIECVHEQMETYCKKYFSDKINKLIRKETDLKKQRENLKLYLDSMTSFKILYQMLFGSDKIKKGE